MQFDIGMLFVVIGFPTYSPNTCYRIKYKNNQVAPQLYSRGWVDPVQDLILVRKFGIAENRTGASGSVARTSNHYTREAVLFTGRIVKDTRSCMEATSNKSHPVSISIKAVIGQLGDRHYSWLKSQFGRPWLGKSGSPYDTEWPTAFLWTTLCPQKGLGVPRRIYKHWQYLFLCSTMIHDLQITSLFTAEQSVMIQNIFIRKTPCGGGLEYLHRSPCES
jgi:hypothetical protein